jgi:flagellar motor switch protein FliM
LLLSPVLLDSALESTRQLQANKQTAPLNSRQEAISFQRTSLDVRAGEATLTVRELVSLSEGDVIRLNTKVGEPFRVLSSRNKSVCYAFIGAQDGNRAVQLARNP